MRYTTSLLFVGLVCLIAAPLHAELVDNPQYQSWAKQKVGTKITTTMAMGMQGFNMNGSMVTELKEVTPEKVVVEVTTQMGGPGGGTRPQTIPAKIEKGQEYVPAGYQGTVKESGNEKVKVAGKDYDCKVVEFTGTSPQGASGSGKVWVTPEIPGTTAKVDMTMQSPQMPGQTMTVTMTVSEIAKKE